MSKYFKVQGEALSREYNSCPNCGDGYFLGKHKDREVCGRCGHTEYKGKSTRRRQKK